MILNIRQLLNKGGQNPSTPYRDSLEAAVEVPRQYLYKRIGLIPRLLRRAVRSFEDRVDFRVKKKVVML